MNRGIKFEIPNEYGDNLGRIFSEFPVDDYYWVLLDADVYKACPHPEDNSFFEKIEYEGPEFRQKIEAKHYIVFFSVIAFPSAASAKLKVRTYQEFLQSDARLCFNVIDSGYVSVYTRNPEDTELFTKNGNAIHCSPVEAIPENDKVDELSQGMVDWLLAHGMI
ncbi:MAG: DUF2691 family protein [Oscillospiraceae bacterium]|jgi:hypothetical protein|nr:DUF2691 family protein [Oscillospiraceae bacterium]